MTTILMENEWAERMINERRLGNNLTNTLRMVARYYLDMGFNRKDTRSKVEEYLVRCDPTISIPKVTERIKTAIRWAAKRPSVNIGAIDISKEEIETIDSLDGKQVRRLAFTLLCLAKYSGVVNPNNDGWVNTDDNEIMKMANISTSIKRQGLLYWKLREAGLIQFSKKVDNTGVKVLFMQDGESVIHIVDMRNLGYQYLMYHGEPYFECVNCGITTKQSDPNNKRRQKYCPECAEKMRVKQCVEAVMRNRSVDKSANLFIN